MAGSLNIPVTFEARIDKAVSNINKFTQTVKSAANTLDDRLGGTDYFAPMRDSLSAIGTDMGRIVQGIILAQGFYRTVDAIQAATSAMWEYVDSINYAQITFSNLFRSTDLAEEFVAVLQQYAARSPFDFTDVEEAARSLAAYGIEAENMMFVIQGIGNLASVTGDYSATFDRVARAIGQINSKGKLMGEEMRQLAEAGLNVNAVYQLLGTSAETVADDNIAAADAINAIIDVLNSEYAGAVDTANMTVRGMIANIRDLVLTVGQQAFQPLYDGFHSVLGGIYEGFNEFQNFFQQGGLAYAIEQMFGPEALQSVTNFLNILARVGTMIVQILAPALQLASMWGQAFSSVLLALLTALMPIVEMVSAAATAFLNFVATSRVLQGVLMGVVIAMLAARAATVAMMVVQVLQKVLAGVTAVLQAVSMAMQVFSMTMATGAGVAVAAGQAWTAFAGALNVNPIVLAITVVLSLVAALVGLRSILGGVSSAASAMSGFDASDFLNSIQPASGDINKFNNRLSNTNDQLENAQDNLEDTGDAAKKAAEGLLSFDEVFSLPEDSATDKGALDDLTDIGDIEMPDFSDLEIPEIEPVDWGDIFQFDTATGLWDAIVAWFQGLKWDDIAGYISTGLITALSTGLGSQVVTAIGTLISNGITNPSSWKAMASGVSWSSLATSIKNGIIAGLLSMGFDFIFDQIAGWLSDNGFSGAGRVVEALSGPFASGLATLIVTKNPFTAAISMLVTGFMDNLETGMASGDWTGFGNSVLGLIGTGLTYALQGGSKTGAFLAVGSLVTNSIFGAISDDLEANGQPEAAEIATKVGNTLSMALSGASIGAAFGPVGIAVGAALGGILGVVLNFGDDIAGWWNDTAWPWLSGLGSDIGEAVSGFGEAASDCWNNDVVPFFQGIPDAVGNFFSGCGDWLTDRGSDIVDGLKGGADTAWNNVDTFFGGVPSKITSFFTGAPSWLTNKGKDIITGAKNGITNGWNSITSWFRNIPNSIRGFFSGAGSWLRSAGSSIVSGLLNGLTSGFSSVIRTVSGWAGQILSHKGPEEYDKQLLVPAGKWITSGLLTGLESQFPAVLTAMSGLGPKMQEAFQAPTITADASATGTNAFNSGSGGTTTTVDNPYYTENQSGGQSDNKPILYVHTLIADKQGLRELQKKLDVIKKEEDRWK